MSFLQWLKGLFQRVRVPPSDRLCSNCCYADPQKLVTLAEIEGPAGMHLHHLQSGNWHPRGKDNSPLAWCNQHSMGVALNAVACDEWEGRGRG